jgi:hypothetical protein
MSDRVAKTSIKTVRRPLEANLRLSSKSELQRDLSEVVTMFRRNLKAALRHVIADEVQRLMKGR